MAVSFFLNASFRAKNFSEFDPTLTANNYGLKPLNLRNYLIFEILRTSYGTTLDTAYLLKFLNNLHFSLSSFCVFWCFQHRELCRDRRLCAFFKILKPDLFTVKKDGKLLDGSLLQAGKPSKTGDEKGAAPTADCQAEDGSALSGG